MNPPRQFSSGIALVLGGGGSAGNAWLIGVIAGLVDAGLDVTDVELVVGTSAGSTAAAQVTGASPAKLLADILAMPDPGTGTAGSVHRPGGTSSVRDHLERTSAIIAASHDAADMRRRLGAMALEADVESDGSAQRRWHDTVAARLPSQRWPQRRVLITAVDADSGEPVVFDRHSGVELVDAVAASCSSAFAYPIGDRRYIDGGYRTNADNADLAAGYGRVLVLSPFGGRSRTPVEWGLHLATQVDALRANGSNVETIFPDRDSEHLFGAQAMNPATRPPAARAGYAQGRAFAERHGGGWH
jgi:NTE family protein